MADIRNVKVRVKGRNQLLSVGEVFDDMDIAMQEIWKAKARYPLVEGIEKVFPKLVRPDHVTDYQDWCHEMVVVHVHGLL